MVAYTSALLAAANLLALAQAAPAQPVCQAVITVITGSPIWVPRADPTGGAGWGAWPPKGGSSAPGGTTSVPKGTTTTVPTTWTSKTGGGFYTTSTAPVSVSTTTTPTTISVMTSTITPTITTPTTTISTTIDTATPSTTTAAPPAPTCDATAISYFSASPAGSCDCDFSVTCNMHAPYTASTNFWERTSGEIINSLAECQAICNENSACTAAIWVNRDGAPSNEYLRCWQTSGLPQADTDGYGQISYKGSCASSCSQNYSSTGGS